MPNRLAFAIVLFTGQISAAADCKIGIVGDSGATGTLADFSMKAQVPLTLYRFGLLPKIQGVLPRKHEFDRRPIQKVPELLPYIGDLAAPTRIWYAPEELEQDKKTRDKVLEHKAEQEIFDVEEYSWGYIAGRMQSHSPNQICIAAEGGQKINSVAKQINRLASHNGTLPPDVYVFYTANDLCDLTIDKSADAFAAEYAAKVKTEIEAATRQNPHPNGTKISLMAPLNFLQVLTNKKLLAHKIPYRSCELTCLEFMTDKRESCFDTKSEKQAGDFWDYLFAKTEKTCKPLFRVLKDSVKTGRPVQSYAEFQYFQQTFRKTIKAQREIIQSLKLPQGFEIEFIESTSRLQFEGGDLSNDCFHPSLYGHLKIAKLLLERKHSKASPNECVPYTPVNLRNVLRVDHDLRRRNPLPF